MLYFSKKKRYSYNSFILGLIFGIFISFLISLLNVQTPIIRYQIKTFPPLKKYRTFHQCLYQPIPYVSDMLETAQYLLSHPNTSFIRYGDGEASLILGKSIHFQTAHPDLGRRLLQGLTSPDPNIAIGIPKIFSGPEQLSVREQSWWYNRDQYRQFFLKHANMSRQYFWTSISAAYTSAGNTSCHLLPTLYRTLREIWEGRDIVLVRGENNQRYEYDIYGNAKTQRIIHTNHEDAWGEYETIKERVLSYDPNSWLFIVTCGPACKVLAYDLAMAGRRALDLGHLAKDYEVYLSHKVYDNFYMD